MWLMSDMSTQAQLLPQDPFEQESTGFDPSFCNPVATLENLGQQVPIPALQAINHENVVDVADGVMSRVQETVYAQD